MSIVMKKLILSIAVFSAAFLEVRASEGEVQTSSTIEKVTVFIQGAQIERKASVRIPKGMSTIVFDNLASQIDRNSLQATGLGKFTITDIQYRHFYPAPNPRKPIPNSVNEKILHLEDSLKMVALKLELQNSHMATLVKEEQFIERHPLITGRANADSLELMIATTKFYRARLHEIASKKYNLKRAQARTNKLYGAINAELTVQRNYRNTLNQTKPNAPRHQVLVNVVAQAPIYGVVEVNYFSRAARWSPMYDLHATNIKDKLRLVYKAIVFQQTGVDWKDVKLKISNANPYQNKIKPKLPMWYVRYYRRVVQAKKMRTRAYTESTLNSVAVEKDMDVMDDALPEEEAEMSFDYTQKVHNFSSVEFEIDLPYQIKSDGKAHYVMLKEERLETRFEHHLVPKLERASFVVAQLSGWRNLDLLVGNANIFFGNTFVGSTVVDPTIVSDTLSISMGRDERVYSTTKVLKSSTKDKLLGNKKIYEATREIKIMNNHPTPINVVVEDQIPMAGEKEISVAMTEMDGSKLIERSGLLTWKFDLRARDRKDLKFGYTIEYPEDKKLVGL